MVLALVAGCVHRPALEVDSFRDCVEAGGQILEIYPRQCHLPGVGTFTEELDADFHVEGIDYGDHYRFIYTPSLGLPRDYTITYTLTGRDVVSGMLVEDVSPEDPIVVRTEDHPPRVEIDMRIVETDGDVAYEGKMIFTRVGARVCEDLCGDGECQANVCMGEGCPCPETPENCPQDC